MERKNPEFNAKQRDLGRTNTRWRKVREHVSQALVRYVYQQHWIITKDSSFTYEQFIVLLPALLSVVFVFTSGSSPAREPGDRVGIGRVIDCVGNSVNYNRRVFSISFFVIHKDITLATRIANKGLLPMDLSGSALQLAEKWRKWKRAFEYYADGKSIDNARKKTSQLLHFSGMEVQDIFEDLQDPGPIPETGDNAFKIEIRKLDSHFRVEENIPYERHVFRQLAPKEEETADQFMVRLRKQARHCNFGTSLNDNLRDQLIEKLTDFDLKRKLLEQRNITLEEALDKVRAWEAGGLQASNMTTSTPLADGNSVNVAKERSRRRMTRGKSAIIVEGRGIWPEMETVRVREKVIKRQRISGGRPRQVANFVGNQEASGSDKDCVFAFMVTETKEEIGDTISCVEPVIEICVDGISTKALLDSGSVSNLMGMSKYEELKAQGLDVKFENCHKRLYA